jgi:GNAT superfamily N-acetyltransferase
MLAVEIVPLHAADLAQYAAVPIDYLATHRLRPTAGGLPSVELREPLPIPLVKDYDRLPGMSPIEWHTRFQLDTWGLFVARQDDRVVGGAAVAPATEPALVDASFGEAAVLWDLRVAPALRGRRVGTALFRAAKEWAATHGHATLLAESQDINVEACRFYSAMGCSLIAYEPGAYPELPEEARLIWRCDLQIDPLAG